MSDKLNKVQPEEDKHINNSNKYYMIGFDE